MHVVTPYVEIFSSDLRVQCLFRVRCSSTQKAGLLRTRNSNGSARVFFMSFTIVRRRWHICYWWNLSSNSNRCFFCLFVCLLSFALFCLFFDKLILLVFIICQLADLFQLLPLASGSSNNPLFCILISKNSLTWAGLNRAGRVIHV